MKKLMKKISIILSIALMACLFTGCNSSKKVVNFLNYGENIDSETLKEFKDKYNIKVNVDTFDDMET
ncbi:MAG: spermidine/putrescine ABC transporter substrate-binding protein, partial [Clostridium sp.]|nr:spermidine/putrescine ABC transporter substrate-binding protein [Clostridium sp.]